IKKENAVMSKTGFAGACSRASAHEGWSGCRVMRSPKRTPAEVTFIEPHGAHGCDGGDFKRFSGGQPRKQPRQALRQHALSRSRRPDHQQAVSAGGSDHQRSLCMDLTSNIGEVERVSVRLRWKELRVAAVAVGQ